MILRDRICDRLQQHRFTGAWRSDDQSTLAFADRRDEVDDTGRDLVGLSLDLHAELFVRIERR